MSSNGKNRKLVVVQLSGGNDYLNCVVPYNNPLYADNRPNIRITEDRAIPIDEDYGFNPGMAPIKDLWDEGKVAIVHGVGYPNPNRSHFRSMDIWHTAEPTKVGNQGWLGQALREMDPSGENVVGAVNFGAGLPALSYRPAFPWLQSRTLKATVCSMTSTARTSGQRRSKSSPTCTRRRSAADR